MSGARRLAVIAAVLVSSGAPARPTPPGESPAEGSPAQEPQDASGWLRRGDALVKSGEHAAALDAWTRAYFEKLPEYRDLEFRFPVASKTMGRRELRSFLLGELPKEYPDEKIAADRLAYSRFGFFGSSLDLKKVIVDLMTDEIAGFYNPETKRLYLIAEPAKPEKKPGLWQKIFGSSDAFDPDEQKFILSHEMAHALADQHFDLNSLTRSAEHDDDMLLAVSALVEGEAMLVMMVDAVDNGSGEGRAFLSEASGISGALISFLTSLGSLFAGGESFRSAPLILRESLLFPYNRGMLFCGRLTRDGTWEDVDRAFRDPPTSSEQILHPEKYAGETRDEPQSLRFSGEFPLEEGAWELVKENTLGEFAIEVLLRPKLGRADSTAAAAGWDGDIYHVYRGKGAADEAAILVWASTWDSEAEAEEFVGGFLQYRGVEDGSADEVVVPEGVPPPERLWKRPEGVSGVWRRGPDVFFLDAVPAERLAEVARWSLRIEREPKKFRFRRVKTEVQFPGEEGEPPAEPPSRQCRPEAGGEGETPAEGCDRASRKRRRGCVPHGVDARPDGRHPGAGVGYRVRFGRAAAPECGTASGPASVSRSPAAVAGAACRRPPVADAVGAPRDAGRSPVFGTARRGPRPAGWHATHERGSSALPPLRTTATVRPSNSAR